jgi:hypothetical protein
LLARVSGHPSCPSIFILWPLRSENSGHQISLLLNLHETLIADIPTSFIRRMKALYCRFLIFSRRYSIFNTLRLFLERNHACLLLQLHSLIHLAWDYCGRLLLLLAHLNRPYDETLPVFSSYFRLKFQWELLQSPHFTSWLGSLLKLPILLSLARDSHGCLYPHLLASVHVRQATWWLI